MDLVCAQWVEDHGVDDMWKSVEARSTPRAQRGAKVRPSPPDPQPPRGSGDPHSTTDLAFGLAAAPACPFVGGIGVSADRGWSHGSFANRRQFTLSVFRSGDERTGIELNSAPRRRLRRRSGYSARERGCVGKTRVRGRNGPMSFTLDETGPCHVQAGAARGREVTGTLLVDSIADGARVRCPDKDRCGVPST